MNIRPAKSKDIDLLAQYDTHISREEINDIIRRDRIYIAEENGRLAGWLRYNLFWDQIPFMNLLYVLEEHRGNGLGKALVLFWERQMEQSGYQTVLTSTQADEYAQHFYFRLGYEAVGGFRLDGEPYELIFSKSIQKRESKSA